LNSPLVSCCRRHSNSSAWTSDASSRHRRHSERSREVFRDGGRT